MHAKLTDRDLVVLLGKDRDAKALEELTRRWDSRVFSFLAKATGDLETAKDLRQEVFLRIWQYGASYSPDYAFTTWFFKLVSNVLATWRSRHRRTILATHASEESQLRSSSVVDPAPGPHERAVLAEVGENLLGLIRALTPEERELILLRLEMNLSYREIASVLDRPETTIKSRYYVVLAKLRKALIPSTTSHRSVMP